MKTFSFKIYIWTIEILKDVYIKNEIIKHKKRLNLQIDNYFILFNQITLTYLFSILIRYPSQFYFLNRMLMCGTGVWFMHCHPEVPYQLGPEDGLGCHGWKASQSKAASSTFRSSQMLNLIFNQWPFFFAFLIPIFKFFSFCFFVHGCP